MSMRFQFFKSRSKKKERELIEMAKIYLEYKDCLEEFLIEVDLRSFKHVSTKKWLNPFVVYHYVSKCKDWIFFAPMVIVLLFNFSMLFFKLFFGSMFGLIAAYCVTFISIVVPICMFFIMKKQNDAQKALMVIEYNFLKSELGL